MQHSFGDVDLTIHEDYYAPGRLGGVERTWEGDVEPEPGANHARLVSATQPTITGSLEIECLGQGSYDAARTKADAILAEIAMVNGGTSRPYIEQFMDQSFARTFTMLFIPRVKEVDRDLAGACIIVLQIPVIICDGTTSDA